MWKAVEVGDWIAARKTSLEEARATVTEVSAWKDGDRRSVSTSRRAKEIRVSDAERRKAYDSVPKKITDSLADARTRIERFHSLQPVTSGSRRSSPASSSG
jgi:histidinol dehydrogenase